MESDPEVRDACYAALGSAMRVIGEKAMGTLITDIAEDKLKMAKVQMFFFTIIAAVSYEAALLYTVQAVSPALVVSLPQLSEGFLALLGISHASYLTSKSICSTPAAK